MTDRAFTAFSITTAALVVALALTLLLGRGALVRRNAEIVRLDTDIAAATTAAVNAAAVTQAQIDTQFCEGKIDGFLTGIGVANNYYMAQTGQALLPPPPENFIDNAMAECLDERNSQGQ